MPTLPGAARRFTGSYETGSLSGRFPTVSWFGDDPNRIDGESWRLRVEGQVARAIELDYAEALRRTNESRKALIDYLDSPDSELDLKPDRRIRVEAPQPLQSSE